MVLPHSRILSLLKSRIMLKTRPSDEVPQAAQEEKITQYVIVLAVSAISIRIMAKKCIKHFLGDGHGLL